MLDPFTFPALLAVAIAIVIAGYAFWIRRRHGRMRWPGSESGWLAASNSSGGAGAFPPTRVMSYAEALQAGWLEEREQRPSPPQGQPRLRLKLHGASQDTRFATMTVLQIVDDGIERIFCAREEGQDEVQRISITRIAAALDLEQRVRIEDPWSWLKARVPLRTPARPAAHGHDGPVHRDGSVDTAIYPA